MRNQENIELNKKLLNELNNDFKEQVIKLKKDYYNSLNEVENYEQFCKVYNKTSTHQNTTIPIFKNNKSGTLNENDEILAEQFVKSSNDKYRPLNLNLNNERLKSTNAEELDRLINKLNNKKAPGPDNITNKLIKIIYANDKEFIIKLFNKILEKGKIPNSWKIGKMIFFNKPNNNSSEPNNYRPITLINGWCKIVERLFIDRIENYLNEKEFFSNTQFGFKKKTSTTDAIKKIIELIDKRKKSNYKLIVAVDISGAFDGINHLVIVNNVTEIGADGVIVNAIENLLVNRRIIVGNKIHSSSRGCPQGGCASPTLWKIGMNSLLIKLDQAKIKNVAFADDLTLVLCEDSEYRLQRKLDEAMKIIEEWCSKAELAINANKTQVMLVKSKKMNNKLKINEKEIKVTNEIKYLGVVIDKKLSWLKHLEHLEKKVELLLVRIRTFNWMKQEIELQKK